MKPFLRQTLDRQLLRLHELDALLSASDVVSDMDRFRSLTREHSEIGHEQELRIFLTNS